MGQIELSWRTWLRDDRSIQIEMNQSSDRDSYPYRATVTVLVLTGTPGVRLEHTEVGKDPDAAADAAVRGLRRKVRELLDEA